MAHISPSPATKALMLAFDEVSQSLKVTLLNAEVDINVSAFTDSVALADVSGNKVTTTLVGAKRSLDVNITDLTIDAANDSIAIKNGSNTLGIGADGSAQIDGRRANTILFAPVSVSSSGANAIVAANATKKIKLLSYSLVTSGAVALKWQSGSTDLTGVMNFSANGGISSSIGSPSNGWLLETAINQTLNLNLGSAVAVGGHISYFLEE